LRSPDEIDVGVRILTHLDQHDPDGQDHKHSDHAQNEGPPPGLLAAWFAV